MRIFHWIHRKFKQNNEDDHDYGVKDSSDGSGRWPRILQDKTPCIENYLDERAKRVRIQMEDKVKGCSGKDINYNEDTEALLGPRDSTVTELFSNWQNGLLAIGTFGIDQNGQDYGYESMDTEEDFLFKETDDEEELVDSSEVEVLAGKLGELFGLKNEVPNVKQNKEKGFVKKYSTSDLHNKISGYDNKDNTNHGNKIYPLQEFFEVPLLAGTVTERQRRTTLADLFSRSKNYRSSNMLDDVTKAEFRSEVVENKMKVESQVKSGGSLAKKVLKWKKKGGELHRPKQWMMKMLKKKIHPEVAAELHGNEVMGYIDVSKSFVSASKHKELNICNSSVDGNDSLTKGTSELVTLLRDSSRGSQECWIKTDSEYVVLEL